MEQRIYTMKDKRNSSAGRLSTSGIIVCVAMAAAVIGIIIFVAVTMLRGDKEEVTTSAPKAEVTTAATEKKTEKKTEAPTTEVPTTEKPTTEAKLPDGTKYEVPSPCGNGYVLDGQIFSAACAGTGTADYYVDMVNDVGARLKKNKATLYDIVVPTAFGACLSKEVQEEMVGNNQPDIINYINNTIDENYAVGVDACSNIIKHNAEYIYFNSDHHWTVMGAYYAYEAWCRAKGIKAHKTDDFFTTYMFEGFLGSFYSLAGYPSFLDKNRDTVLAFVPNGTNEEVFIDESGERYNWNVIRDVTDWAKTSKYNCFIGGDNPYTEIENPMIHNGSACILIKESYGNAFAPFLVDHYQYTYVIDYRYYTGNLTSFVSSHKVKDVIIVTNMEAIGGSRADKIRALFP